LIEFSSIVNTVGVEAKEVFIFLVADYSLDPVNGFLVEFFSGGELVVDGFLLVGKFLGWH
jgi:hypothetical protein